MKMKLHTRYLGLDLASPILPGASPMGDDPDFARRLEDAGAPAIVMSSLFEEELPTPGSAPRKSPAPGSARISGGGASGGGNVSGGGPVSGGGRLADAVPSIYQHSRLHVDPEDYFDRVFRLKHALGVPVIASLNGTTAGGWLRCAQAIEQAGADALELNVYKVVTELSETADEVERDLFAMVKQVRGALAIPVAVKLSPFYTSLPNVASHLTEAGADALVLFNRFYQPEIDWPAMTFRRTLRATDPGELNLRLRWCAILAGRVKADLCVTGGITSGEDVARSIACGATVVQVVTTLMHQGPEYYGTLHAELLEAMDQAGVHSIEGLCSRLSISDRPRREALVRANYYRLLRTTARDSQNGAAGDA